MTHSEPWLGLLPVTVTATAIIWQGTDSIHWSWSRPSWESWKVPTARVVTMMAMTYVNGSSKVVDQIVAEEHTMCHDTTDHGLTQLESFWDWVLGVGQGSVPLFLRVCRPVWNAGLVVLPRLLFVVCLCPDEGTSTRGKKRANEVL